MGGRGAEGARETLPGVHGRREKESVRRKVIVSDVIEPNQPMRMSLRKAHSWIDYSDGTSRFHFAFPFLKRRSFCLDFLSIRVTNILEFTTVAVFD
jgi:hypothetical protein